MRASPQSSDLFRRIYTFGGIAFAIKILPLTSVKLQDAEFTLAQKAVGIGMLAVLTGLLTVAAALSLWRDLIRERNASILNAESDSGDAVAVINREALPADDRIAMDSSLYMIISAIVFILESVVPILFGIFIVLINWGDIWEFIGYAWMVIVTEVFSWRA